MVKETQLYTLETLGKIFEELQKSDLDLAVILLYNLVKDRNAKTILELGVRDGISTRAFLLACKEINGHLYSVDIKDYPKTRKIIEEMKLDKYWTYYIMDDRKFYKIWKKKVDLLFIDTSHKFEHTLFELEQYSKFVKKNGIILLHDTLAEMWPGVKQAIDEFIKLHPEWKYKELGSKHGLGCLWRTSY